LGQERAEAEREEWRAQATVAEAARAEAVAAAASERKALADRLTAAVLAHRGLIVDVMRRLVEREADRARSRQGSPEKILAWVETFYVTFEESALEALLPAVRVHLAWTQSADDPRTVARALVQAHIKESVRQLRAVADAEAHEWQADFAKMLIRWETDRPEAAADALVREEIDYVRSLQP
jgi:hypothetical protein